MGWLGTTGLALLLMTAAQENHAGKPTPPTDNGRPVKVTIGFYLLDFARITSRDESFDATGYLEMSWRDPRLAWTRRPGEGERDTHRVDASETWTPRIFFENAVEQPKIHNDPVVEVDPTGLVTGWMIISGKFSSEMSLRSLPIPPPMG